jgi:hypothetical protein
MNSHFGSIDPASNSSERLFCGHWLGGAVTRTCTVSIVRPPEASVTVSRAL